jgi:hypothetical protein
MNLIMVLVVIPVQSQDVFFSVVRNKLILMIRMMMTSKRFRKRTVSSLRIESSGINVHQEKR